MPEQGHDSSQAKAQNRRSRVQLPKVLGIVAIVSACLLLLGAAQRSGRLPGLGFVWTAWAAIGSGQFVVLLVVLAGLLGAGSWAMALSWKHQGQVNLLVATAFLLAGGALLMGATYNKQWGASQTVPLVLGLGLAAGFVGILLTLYRRVAVKVPQSEGEAKTQ